MKCPLCTNEMEEGYLQGNNRVAWVKKRHKISLLPKKGEILLENNAFKDFIFKGWICKKCKKILIDYLDKEVREG